jgi:hypothetical protein
MLNPGILYPSSRRIRLTGRLHNEVKYTPAGKNYPGREAYREFELHHWYILTPFEEDRGDGLKPVLIKKGG